MAAWVAGVDGCRAGWIAVLCNVATGTWHFCFAPTLADIVDGNERPRVIAIDMPTGFAECAERGGRPCERAARALLRTRGCTVFPTPCRDALSMDTYPDASEANRQSGSDRRGLTVQTYGLFRKMRELDDLLRSRSSLRQRIFEAHPELAFLRMNDHQPVLRSKSTVDGQSARQRLLANNEFAEIESVWSNYRQNAHLRSSDVAIDDALDAAAVCRTALLIYRQEATHLPATIERDRHGLPMAIWY